MEDTKMENNIQVFNNEEFGSVRTIIDGESILFCAKDVASALGYKDPNDAVRTHCKWVVKRPLPHPQSPEKQIEASFIPENDVYRLIMRSKLPSAEKFEAWVMDDVLPTIRKTGGYIADPEKFINEYFSALSEDTKRGFALDMYRETKRLGEQNRQLTATTEEQRPHVEFANQVTASEDAIDMGLYSKTIQKFGVTIGRNTLFRKLRECGVLMADNTPYQRFLNSGWFKVIEYTCEVGGVPRLGTKTLVTGKGQIRIAELVRNNFAFGEAC